MLSTGAAFAYSRDPSAIFQAPECGFPPPLNFESVLSDGVQPVRYCKKRLLQTLDGFKNQDEIVEVSPKNEAECWGGSGGGGARSGGVGGGILDLYPKNEARD